MVYAMCPYRPTKVYFAVCMLYIKNDLTYLYWHIDSFRARMNSPICWERVECTEIIRSTRSWTGLFAELIENVEFFLNENHF